MKLINLMNHLPSHIFLTDNNASLVAEWLDCFSDVPDVSIYEGDYFARPADAIVSPANSFGYMDGGLDLAIRNELGLNMQDTVQDAILEAFHGEIPVGSALIVPTNDSRWPHLICAPTMRVPENVSHTLNAYLAFRATILEIKKYNQVASKKIDSVVCCGFATGVGRMTPQRCAGQMRVAYSLLYDVPRIGSFQHIHHLHLKLSTL